MAFGGFGGRKQASKFSPRQVTALSGWLRLDSSTPVAGEWPTIVDVLNAGSPMVQTSVNRKTAVGISSNGLRTMVFDATDVHLWPVSPAHSSTTKVGFWFWFKPASLVAANQWLYSVIGTIAGAPNNRFRFGAAGSTFYFQIWVDASNARQFTTASNFFTIGTWTAIYVQYDSSRGGDANIAIYKNGVLVSTTPADAGGTVGPTGLTVLQAGGGSATIGAFGDSDAPSGPIAIGGEIGPNIFAFNNNLSADQIASFLAYESPVPVFGGARINCVTNYPRLALSSPVASEWETIVDALGGTSLVQTSANRKAAIGTALNCQTMVLDGSDMYTLAASALTYSATKIGYLFWLKPATITGTQTFLFAPTNGAVLQFYMTGAGLQFSIYMDAGATKGRNASVSNVLTPGAWHFIYWQYDSSRGGDANELLFINAIAVPLTYTNQGIGQTLDVLQPVTGNIVCYAGANSDAPSSSFANGTEVTPIIVVNDNLTADQLTALMAYEAPVPVIGGIAIPISGWLRLASSTAVAGEWPTVVDLMNAGSPMVQTSAVRKTAVGVSINGYPTMIFDGSDMHLWPVSPAHSSKSKVGFWIWYKPASLVSYQPLYFNRNGAAGCTTDRISLRAEGSKIHIDVFVDNTPNGRGFDSANNVLVVGVWHAIYFQYDSSRGGDANVALYIDGVSKALTPSAIGTGGAASLGLLQAATGSAVLGSFNDSDAGSSPLANGAEFGPNIFAFSDNLTAVQIAALMTFETPAPIISGLAISPLTSWLRFAQGTSDANGFSSVPDVLNSNPAIQTVNANKPARVLSTNGLVVADFNTDDRLVWPLTPQNNNTSAWGAMFWVIPDHITAGITERWIDIWYDNGNGASGGASAPKITIGKIAGTVHTVVRNGGASPTATTGIALAAGVPVCIGAESNGARSSDANKLVITINGVAVSSTFTGGAMPTALSAPAGGINIGAYVQGNAHYSGLLGPNLFIFSSVMPGVASGMLTPAARLAIKNLEAPT